MENQNIDLTIVLATLNEIENLPLLCSSIDELENNGSKLQNENDEIKKRF